MTGRGRFVPIVTLAALPFAACEKLPEAPPLPNVLPVASFFFNPVSPIYAGQTPVLFNGTASRDSDGQIVSYVWNYGDGTPAQTTTGPTVVHVFPDTGERCRNVAYGVSLTVVDDRGGQTLTANTVTVVELPLPSDPACPPPPS